AFTWGVLDRLPLDARPFADLPRDGPDDALVLPLRSQPRRHKSLAQYPCRDRPFCRLAQASIKLFVTATNVRTGRGRVFRNSEITPNVLLASACLPTLFHALP